MYEKWSNQLMKVELFEGLSQEELLIILNCLMPSIKNYAKKDIIAIKNEKLTSIGIVLEGAVTVGKETLSGDRVMMKRFCEGELFGEIAAFSNDGWLATVVADTDCKILFFPPHKIVGLCNNLCSGHFKLINNMMNIIAKRALMLNKKVEILSLKSIRQKISTYLLTEYNRNNSLTFNISFKRNELADYLQVSRPSLSRELIKMKKEGMIDFKRNTFKIVDIETLRVCLEH